MIASTSFIFLNSISPSDNLIISYPILMGMLCGVASLIPMVGLKLVWVPMFLFMCFKVYVFGLFSSSIYGFLFVFLLIVNIVVDWIPDLVLRPYISGKNIHTGVMMLSYILGPAAFGAVGIFVGPLIVIFSTNFVKIVLPQLVSAKK